MSNAHATLKLTSDFSGNCDLVVKRKADGIGYLALTQSFIPSLLIALNSDRRADPEDITPPMQTMPEGTKSPLFSRRGWCGDFLLEEGHRAGSKLWLLERAKRTASTALAAHDYAIEALKPICDYHKADLSVLTGWDARHKQRLNLDIRVNGQKIQTGRDL